jgi:hypothetical protein
LGKQISISNPLEEVLVGILLTPKKRISTFEAKLALQKQSMVYLVNRHKFRNGTPTSSSTKHGILRGKVLVQQANMNETLTNGTSILGWSFLWCFTSFFVSYVI